MFGNRKRLCASWLLFNSVCFLFLQEIPTPMPINELIDQLPVVQVQWECSWRWFTCIISMLTPARVCVCQGRSRPIRVLNRLTVVMSDSSHFVSVDFILVSLFLPQTWNRKKLCVCLPVCVFRGRTLRSIVVSTFWPCSRPRRNSSTWDSLTHRSSLCLTDSCVTGSRTDADFP